MIEIILTLLLTLRFYKNYDFTYKIGGFVIFYFTWKFVIVVYLIYLYARYDYDKLHEYWDRDIFKFGWFWDR